MGLQAGKIAVVRYEIDRSPLIYFKIFPYIQIEKGSLLNSLSHGIHEELRVFDSILISQVSNLLVKLIRSFSCQWSGRDERLRVCIISFLRLP